MTNGAHYRKGKLHHSPLHGDIRTSTQLNTSPGWLSRPFQTKTVNKGEEEPITHWESPQNKSAQSIHLISDAVANAISSSKFNTCPATISKRTEAISESIPSSNSKAISEAIPVSDSEHSHCNTLLQAGGLQQ
jgi:hypothetical protein